MITSSSVKYGLLKNFSTEKFNNSLRKEIYQCMDYELDLVCLKYLQLDGKCLTIHNTLFHLMSMQVNSPQFYTKATLLEQQLKFLSMFSFCDSPCRNAFVTWSMNQPIKHDNETNKETIAIFDISENLPHISHNKFLNPLPTSSALVDSVVWAFFHWSQIRPRLSLPNLTQTVAQLNLLIFSIMNKKW